MSIQPCPCGGTDFQSCCEPYLTGAAWPATAEALMRSRYSAFALGNRDHLFRTWHPRTRPRTPIEPGTGWTGLEVLAVRAGGVDDTTGEVEFVAHNVQGDQHGDSRFVRRAGRWMYLDEVDAEAATSGNSELS